MKLISMTAFVLEQNKILETYVNHLRKPLFERCVNYANFLKQPLKLEMFVPCDEDGDILDEPEDYELRLTNMMTEYNDEVYRYKQAKEKVLFEGFEVIKQDNITITIEFEHFQLDYNKILNVFANHRTIEDLAKYNLIELTENQIKQIGL